MIDSFYIKENRLDELKSFICKSMPSARFIYNPAKVGNQYHIKLSLDVSDGNKLNILQNKWHDEDNPKIVKITIFKKIFNYFTNIFG